MKKQLILITLLVLMLASLLPVAALAAKPAELAVQVRNHTGAAVELSLTDATGNVTYKTIPVGISTFTLVEGRYSYYASTVCGVQSGPFNASTKEKVLYFGCDNGPVVQYESCQLVALWVEDGSYYDAGQDYRYYHKINIPDWTYEMYLTFWPTTECLVGLQGSDYWDGVKVPDTKP